MSELRVDNIVSQNGSSAPIYSKGLNIPSGQTLTDNGNFVVNGSSTLNGSLVVANTGFTTISGVLNVAGGGTNNFAGNVNVTGALNVLSGGTVNTTGVITAAVIDVGTQINYTNLGIGGSANIGGGVGIGTTSTLGATLNVRDDIILSTGTGLDNDTRIRAVRVLNNGNYDAGLSFEDPVNGDQFFSVTSSTTDPIFSVNLLNLQSAFSINNDSSSNIRLGSVAEKLKRISGNAVNISYGSTQGSNIGVCTNPTGDITLNVNNIPTTSDFDNCSISFSVFVLQGTTARKVSSVNLNGVSKTIRWPGGITGTGNTSCYDIFNFVGINTIGSASTTSNYEVLGQVNEDFRLY